MKIALIQMKIIEEQPDINLKKIIEFSKKAKAMGAQIIIFPEGTLTDYVSDVDRFAQEVPKGDASKKVEKLAKEIDCYISFGLIEKEGLHRHITQVFFGPSGFCYKYRKTWLYTTTDRIKSIRRHRNEHDNFDPGNGPEIFYIENFKATCIICADALSNRCLKIVNQLKPQIVFYPNNREIWQPDNYWAEIAKKVNAPLLITNRVGRSWGEFCEGGCSVYSKEGKLLSKANTEGKEEILLYNLEDLK